jgi:hypothetical protein
MMGEKRKLTVLLYVRLYLVPQVRVSRLFILYIPLYFLSTYT